ncbi:hypothetical protein POTOM_011313 [Populus tomentosa]|uniref:NIF system FeS cluster assembly NifU C-terminal domain-containing protein n=1 Tax=Populus tomentosa TaxID=118781 RepID=A0A8X8D8S4_POPTO|nr:hypothetical protein POTOM_011313 [Populus tomentosa]
MRILPMQEMELELQARAAFNKGLRVLGIYKEEVFWYCALSLIWNLWQEAFVSWSSRFSPVLCNLPLFSDTIGAPNLIALWLFVLEEIRPYLVGAAGGSLELVAIEEPIVKVRLTGPAAGVMTVRVAVTQKLREKIPAIAAVQLL